MKRALATALTLLATLLPGAALAADQALLVGVGRYPALPQRLWLDGPANDVALMREALLARGFAPQQVLSLSDAPTRAQIVAAMAAVLRGVQPGDRVVFHFSGHGSQQPQPAGARQAEPDGLDEVLLPADVRGWAGPGEVAAIPNALRDDEIGDWLDALVDRGAQVWAFFDTCHAAGMARGDATRGLRAVAPAELGLALEARPRPGAPRFGSPRLDGRALFFAGRSHEGVAEEWLPRGAGLARSRRHGVFSWHVAALLREQGLGEPASLLAALQQRYASERRQQPVPVLAGTLAHQARR